MFPRLLSVANSGTDEGDRWAKVNSLLRSSAYEITYA
jgi:hypothetical protein